MDINDEEGDRQAGVWTLPVVLGALNRSCILWQQPRLLLLLCGRSALQLMLAELVHLLSAAYNEQSVQLRYLYLMQGARLHSGSQQDVRRLLWLLRCAVPCLATRLADW